MKQDNTEQDIVDILSVKLQDAMLKIFDEVGRDKIKNLGNTSKFLIVTDLAEYFFYTNTDDDDKNLILYCARGVAND